MNMMCAKEITQMSDSNSTPLEIDESMTVKRFSSNYINENGKTLLQCAREGDAEGVLFLLGKGTPITSDWLGTSPLHLAVMNGHYETCDVLLRAGVNKDVRTKVDRTPLHFAVYDGLTHIAKLLLKSGADVECRDMLQMTPLHWAVEKRHKECVKLLLMHGANPNVMSRFNKTPLTISVEMQWDEVTQMLVKAKRREVPQILKHVPPDVQLKKPFFTYTPDKDILGLNNEKSMSDDSINEMDHEGVDTEKDAESGLESLLPQVDESPNEATLELLKEHGITLIPNDNTNTVNSAIQSGRKIVLSDAGKLVLKEVNLQKEPIKPIEIKKKPIILPSAKMKNAKIYTISGNQFIAMANQSKPNILQKIPVDSFKKTPTNTGLNIVKIPKDTVTIPSWNNSVKILNPTPMKTITNTATVMKNTITGIVSPQKPTIPVLKGELVRFDSKKAKIIKFKGGNFNGAMRLLMKKNNVTTNTFPRIIDPSNTSACNNKDIFQMDVITETTDISTTMDESDKLASDSESEISRLKSELEIANAEIEYYKKTLQEREAELAIYKYRNRDSFMGVETNSVD